MLYALLVAALVALDQLVKYLVVQNIPLGHHVPFLPYILDLTYVQNTGAAFSLFNEHTWILTLISLVMSVVLAVALVKSSSAILWAGCVSACCWREPWATSSTGRFRATWWTCSMCCL